MNGTNSTVLRLMKQKTKLFKYMYTLKKDKLKKVKVNAVSLMESTLTSLLHCLNVHIAFGPSEVVWLSTDDEGSDWTRRVADNMVVEEMKDADWLMDEKQVQRFHLENKSNLISSFKETAATKKKKISL